MKSLIIKVGNIREAKIDLTKLPTHSYEIITSTYWCQGEEFLSFEDFKKSEYFAKGYKCKVEKDQIWFEKCKWGFQFNNEVNILNAKKCGFGVLVYKYTGKEIMFSNFCVEIIPSIIAYQALTYHCVKQHYVPYIIHNNEYFRLIIGSELYNEVMQCLTRDIN